MNDDLYQEFITESEESITQLNNSLLDLESNPDDIDAIDDIFRQAHTLKGNFGAMGFDNAATVAHAVEDLLDAIRNGETDVTPERMDLVFDGMDEILDILREIEEHGDSQRDPSGLVDSLRAAAEAESAAEAATESPAASESNDRTSGGPESGERARNEFGPESESTANVPDDRDSASNADDDPSSNAEDDPSSNVANDGESESDIEGNSDALDLAREVLETGNPALADAAHLYLARIELDVGGMKGVDGGLFVNGLPDDITVVGAEPDLNRIAEGDFGDDFVVFVADASRAELKSTFEGLWKVQSVALTDVGGFLDEATADRSATSAGGHESDGVPDASAAAAVDAVVEAYTATETTDEASGEASENPVKELGDETDATVEVADGDDGAEGGSDESGTQIGRSDTDGLDSDTEDVASDSAMEDTVSDPATEDAASDSDTGATDSDSEREPSISEVKSVRVDVDQLDELHSLVEQLVTSRIKLRQALGTEDTAGKDSIDELDKISSNLQDTVMDMRLIPLKKVFDKFPRLVRDLAREEDKEVRFSVEGQDIELDRTILDEISDPLMHVLRNAVDHGIELPDQRETAGKSRTGTVELRAEREHDTVVITVEDDGGGIDADVIREKAATKGIRSREKLDKLPDEEVYDFVFHPGFSTNDEITDVSGRGVGMDVVKTTVESLDGSVNVDSTLGAGTRISIRLPVTVAIIKVLFVRIGDREFGVPIKYIDEISRQQRIQRVDGAEVVVHADHIFPLIRLRDALDLGEKRHEDGMIVRIRPADRQVALRCDGVARQEEVVVTPLQGPLKGTNGLSGTAVVGDGNVVPILDINSLSIPSRGKQARREWVPPEDDGVEAEGAAD
ncbi:chemotaxis protein CheA [Halobellus captivus]|uniref:chemotaxis protein CheA n=1 Tax=Halobellus captivus TaxID=2592614 RepID=UPI00119F6D5C|nr:chemotaxis protein CheA [Halobellus captivus]